MAQSERGLNIHVGEVYKRLVTGWVVVRYARSHEQEGMAVAPVLGPAGWPASRECIHPTHGRQLDGSSDPRIACGGWINRFILPSRLGWIRARATGIARVACVERPPASSLSIFRSNPRSTSLHRDCMFLCVWWTGNEELYGWTLTGRSSTPLYRLPWNGLVQPS